MTPPCTRAIGVPILTGRGILRARLCSPGRYVVSCMSTSMQRETTRPLIPATRPRTPTEP
eukprot:1405404-Prymnesium_polylepis.1